MEQPPRFIHDSYLVSRLKKSLYGLKHVLRSWYTNMESYLMSQNFVRCKYDPNLYTIMNIDSLMILVCYADDLLITSYLNSLIVVVKGILHDTFLMKDMHPFHYLVLKLPRIP
jgi:hypothetical protein